MNEPLGLREAIEFGHTTILPEHLLLALLRQTDSPAVHLLERLGADPDRLQTEIRERAPRGPDPKGLQDAVNNGPHADRILQNITLSPPVVNANQFSKGEAQGHEPGVEHTLLALLRVEGLARDILESHGITLERAREALASHRNDKSSPESVSRNTNGRDITGRNPEGAGRSRSRYVGQTVEDAARRIVRTSLREDLTPGDLTSELTVPAEARSLAVAVAKAEGVIAGMETARQAFLQVDSSVKFTALAQDGDRVSPGDEIFSAEGSSRSILMAERTALNLMQRLSGVATETARYVAEVEGTNASIVDTRKTTPGLRFLEKYAVRVGGGRNHRYNLSDGILIKDNHIVAAGGITAAVERVKKTAPHTLRIEVEVTNEEEVREALAAGADALLLDNMTPDQLKQAVEWVGGRALTEASGGINLKTVRAVAESGVDLISVGALTHSVTALDISLQFRRYEAPE